MSAAYVLIAALPDIQIIYNNLNPLSLSHSVCLSHTDTHTVFTVLAFKRYERF